MYNKIKRQKQKTRYHPYYLYSKKRKYKQKVKIKHALKTKLMPFQDMCVCWLIYGSKTKNKIIPLETGFGKTLISFQFANLNNWNCLCIAPVNVIPHHIDEMKKHFTSHVQTQICNGSFIKFLDMTFISDYVFQRLDKDSFLFKHSFNTIILDEIHTILNDKSKMWQHIKYLKYNNLIGLTASFHEEDILFMDYDVYKLEYSMKRERKIQSSTKSLKLTKEEQILYNQQIDYSSKMIKHKKDRLNHMREWLSTFKIKYISSFMFPRLIKVIICSDFNSTLLQLSLHLPIHSFIKIDSDTKTNRRPKLLKRFETCSQIRFLLCNRKILGLGQDIGFADILIFMEPCLILDETKQMIGRLDRIGQQPMNLKEQQVLELFYEQTCEERIIQCKTEVDLRSLFE